ncbi:MAG: SH3 domain-containing protein [Chloroflexi bacterium]|nr:SH3 domain-containing protein [Chloroflexota bacterium]
MAEFAPGTMTADALNLRNGPGTEHRVLGVLRAGDAVEVTAAVDA